MMDKIQKLYKMTRTTGPMQDKNFSKCIFTSRENLERVLVSCFLFLFFVCLFVCLILFVGLFFMFCFVLFFFFLGGGCFVLVFVLFVCFCLFACFFVSYFCKVLQLPKQGPNQFHSPR